MKTSKKTKKIENSVFAGVFNSKRISALTVFVIAFAIIGTYLLSTSQAYDSTVESDQFSQLNNYRTGRGVSALEKSQCMTKKARMWAKHLAETNQIKFSYFADDSNHIVRDEVKYRDCGGNKIGENVGHGILPQYIFAELDHTEQFKNNMLNSQFSNVGIGAVKDSDGTWWIVQSFSN